MTIETLVKANRVAKELERWRDIGTRLQCGSGFYQISFKAEKNKTMSSEYDYCIDDEKTINAFKAFVNDRIEKCEDELEQL